jgi:hypothetical protein
VWIRIPIRGSMRLTNGSGSFYFHHGPSSFQVKLIYKKSFPVNYFVKVLIHHFQRLKVKNMSQNSRNQCFSYYTCLMIVGSGSGSRAGFGSGSISLTNNPDPGGPKTRGSGFGSGSGTLARRSTVVGFEGVDGPPLSSSPRLPVFPSSSPRLLRARQGGLYGLVNWAQEVGGPGAGGLCSGGQRAGWLVHGC